MPVKKTKKGFTLVELSLSLVFVSILSLTVAYIINDTISSYRKGVVLKQINTVGSGLVDDLRASIQNSSSKSVKDDCSIVYGSLYRGGSVGAAGRNCETDKGKGFVMIRRTANVKGKNGRIDLDDVPVFGAFCTGDYSYIWNSGYFFNDEGRGYEAEGVEAATLKFKSDGKIDGNSVCSKNGTTMTCSGFRLLKIKDESRSVCISGVGASYQPSLADHDFDITENSEAVSETPVDLLASDGTGEGLSLYDLYVAVPTESTAKNNLFYSVSFVLGTIHGGINVKATGGACATPEDYDSENFDYCAINKFNFAAQATGG